MHLYYMALWQKYLCFDMDKPKIILTHTFSGFRQSDLTESGIEEAKQIGEKTKS